MGGPAFDGRRNSSRDQGRSSGGRRQPLPIVVCLFQHLGSGTVIDVGVGDGRNTLFLAESGLQVHAIDNSPAAVSALKSKLRAIHSVEIVCDDAVSFFKRNKDTFDAVVCTFVLHYLSPSDALFLVDAMQRCTRGDGYNVIAAFTAHGDFRHANLDRKRFLLNDAEELQELYSGWEQIELVQKSTKVHIGQTPGTNAFVGLLARKSSPTVH